MKKSMAIAIALGSLISVSATAAIHPGFVNKKQCVYFKDGGSHRSDCTNSNTTCADDGRCTVEFANVVYDGDVESWLVLRREAQFIDEKGYQFEEDDLLDLRKSGLKRNQIILEE